MPDIGNTLREARMRQRLDISEIESTTKIRAKYLRALENEEWDLLPGPTFVKTFLRTYAEELGLDAKLLVEEYKLRHERLSDVEMQPITPRRAGEGRRTSVPAVPRGLLVLGVLLAIVALLALLGGDEEPKQANTLSPPQAESEPPATTPPPGTTEEERQPARPRMAELRIEPTGPIYVCLKARGGRTLVDGDILTARTEPWRSSLFRLRVGNGEARLRINGRVRRLPNTDVAGFEILRSGRLRPLPEARWPSCA